MLKHNVASWTFENGYVAPPKEMLLLFYVVQFLTNYDVTNRKHYIELIYSIVRKGNKGTANYVKGDYLIRLK